MNVSRIDCINIKKPNCEFYDDDRLCPNDCIGFVKKNEKQETENLVKSKHLKDKE